MARREVYTIRWDRALGCWVCPQLGRATGPNGGAAVLTKAEFIRLIAVSLRRRWTFAHIRSQLRVYGKHGRIQFERSYGADPRRYPG